MIAVVDNFQALPPEALHESVIRPPGEFAHREEIAEHARTIGADHGLKYVARILGRDLVIQDRAAKDGRRFLRRQYLYAVAPIGRESIGAASVAIEIAKRHGPGRWWSTGPAVGYCGAEGLSVRSCVIDGVVHAVLAAYYHHDPARPA